MKAMCDTRLSEWLNPWFQHVAILFSRGTSQNIFEMTMEQRER